MNTNKYISDELVAYLEGELKGEAKIAFEQRLQTDNELAEVYQLNQEIDEANRHSKALKVEALLDDIGNEFAGKYNNQSHQSARIRGLRPMSRLVIAASIAVLIGFLLWHFNGTSDQNTATLFAEYYSTYDATSTVRSTDLNVQSDLEAAQKDYQVGNYIAARFAFSDILQRENLSKDDHVIALFYRALSYLAEDNIALAEADLSATLAFSNHNYMQQAYWYQALIFLKKEDKLAAIASLNKVLEVAAQGKYARQARALLEDLK